jgi:lipopolysaccharide/colanic/teichoic acid biosynthesis glycosyltransferase
MNHSTSSSKCLLWIGVFSNHVHDYVDEMAHSYHFPVGEALRFLRDGEDDVDGIVITMLHKPSEILEVKKMATQHDIPLFLYTSTFEPYAKELAIQLGLDEYFYGGLKLSLIKRINSVKKIKEFKKKNKILTGRDGSIWLIMLLVISRRAFDMILSALTILVFSPVLLMISLAIQIGSKGSLLEVFKCVGFGYKAFDLYRFRIPKNDCNFWFKRFGQFVHASRLSELPALFNVLKGEMSMMGSTPLSLSDAEKLTKDHVALRFMTHAGFTGLWRDRDSLLVNRSE